MKYVYAVMTVLNHQPILQTCVSPVRLTGKQVLDKMVLTAEEQEKFADYADEEIILEELNKTQSVRVEIQEIEVK